jgi:hypothetical protein
MRPVIPIVLLCCLTSVSTRAAEPVAARMRHVLFHLGKGIEMRVDDLDGHLVSAAAGPPTFDDVNSYVVEIRYARVSLTAASLTNLMNNYVFAAADAPLKKLKIEIEGNELRQSGVLVKGGVPVPFRLRASLAATADGKIRLHPTSVKAAGFLSKRVLDFFGLDLERLVKVSPATGVTIDGDDLLLDPERLLPPPRIKGRLTRTWIENGEVVQQFGTPVKSPLTPANGRFANYMYYRGGTLRFGKLTMVDTDMVLVDMDQKDPFDFSPEEYNAQLVAGYSKNTRSHGLIVYMPDLSDLRSRSAPRTSGGLQELNPRSSRSQ